MTQPPSSETMRLPAAVRVVGTLMGVVGTVVLSVGLVNAIIEESPAAVIVLGLLAAFAARLKTWRVSVEFRDDELLVRNLLRTHHLRRTDIDRFRVGSTAFRTMPAIWADLREGRSVRLDATAGLYFLYRRHNVREQRLHDLKAWYAQPADRVSETRTYNG